MHENGLIWLFVLTETTESPKTTNNVNSENSENYANSKHSARKIYINLSRSNVFIVLSMLSNVAI